MGRRTSEPVPRREQVKPMVTVYIPTECMKCGANIEIKITDWSESSAYCYPCAATKFYSAEVE